MPTSTNKPLPPPRRNSRASTSERAGLSADGSAEVLAKQNAKVQAENDKLRLQLEEALA